MNVPLLAAAALALFGVAAHGVFAQFNLLRRADGTPLPDLALPRGFGFLAAGTPTKNTELQWRYLKAGWHLFTADLVVSAVALFLCAGGWLDHPDAIARVIGAYFAGHVLVWVLNLGPHNLLRAPQWFGMILIALLSWWGASPM